MKGSSRGLQFACLASPFAFYNTVPRTTILDAMKDAVGGETEVVYEENPSPDTFASQDFSYSIVVVGEPPYCESGGDSQDLRIPLGGEELISLVADRVPTLVILISGRPLYIEPLLLEKMDAFVAAWLPGTEGAGITDVIFGDFEFQGRLPMTWFKSVDQLPMHQERNSYEPLFPFGYGLTSKNKMPPTSRTAFTTLAQLVATHNERPTVISANPVANLAAARIWDFTRMNSLTSLGSKVDENPQEFLDQVQKVKNAMGVTTVESVKLAAYQLQDVAHA
ncbi:hypothetical protein BC332_15092 [Capsicum chinense]|nr:hypothetical protein BC332_15092 [Capsicum chinense]